MGPLLRVKVIETVSGCCFGNDGTYKEALWVIYKLFKVCSLLPHLSGALGSCMINKVKT